MHHKRKVSKTAHFHSLGSMDEPIEDLWIVCHGYGQLAETFIEEFRCLEATGRLIIAPEGLSRFYWGGFTGPVVSSWMTSGDRLDEIKDYCNWMDDLYTEFSPRLGPESKITLLGFSQGTATVMRWLQARQPKLDRLILWAGLTPEDISYLPYRAYFHGLEKIFAFGNMDKFLSPEKLKWQMEFLEEQQLDFEIMPFAGKHKMNSELLLKIAKG